MCLRFSDLFDIQTFMKFCLFILLLLSLDSSPLVCKSHLHLNLLDDGVLSCSAVQVH